MCIISPNSFWLARIAAALFQFDWNPLPRFVRLRIIAAGRGRRPNVYEVPNANRSKSIARLAAKRNDKCMREQRQLS